MTLYSVDTSAWHWSTNSNVAQRWRTLLDEDSIALCDQVRLEILYSARSSDDYKHMANELDGLYGPDGPKGVGASASNAARPPGSESNAATRSSGTSTIRGSASRVTSTSTSSPAATPAAVRFSALRGTR